MVGSPFKVKKKTTKIEEFTQRLSELIERVYFEEELVSRGDSKWTLAQLQGVILPELNELLMHALVGEVYFKYGKKQKMLESTFLINDSLEKLNKTVLGTKILELQKMYNVL